MIGGPTGTMLSASRGGSVLRFLAHDDPPPVAPERDEEVGLAKYALLSVILTRESRFWRDQTIVDSESRQEHTVRGG